MKTTVWPAPALLLFAVLAAAKNAHAWERVGELPHGPRSGGSALLTDGRGMLAGNGVETDVYDPAKTAWKTVAPMSRPRDGVQLVVLGDGRVLALGGIQFVGGTGLVLDRTTEIYDVAADAWLPSAELPDAIDPQSIGPAARLADGRVLLLAGRSAYLFDPIASAWTLAPDPGLATRWQAPRVVPIGGRVLVVDRDLLPSSASARMFDPAIGAWRSTGAMTLTRKGAAVARLFDGRVLVAGGTADAPTSSAEIYDPALDTWTAVASMAIPRENAFAVAVGRRVVVGSPDDLSTEVYDTDSGRWLPDGDLRFVRDNPAIAAFGERVLIAGGAPSRVVEAHTTVADGASCAGDGECSSTHCVDGVCCDRACGDACARCDLASARGVCTPVDGPINHCAEAMVCANGACIPPPTTTCSADRRATIDAAGSATSCGTFLCDPSTGACRELCRTSNDCAPGALCDPVASICAIPTSDEGDGCSTSPRARSAGGAFALVLLAGALARVQRRTARGGRHA